MKPLGRETGAIATSLMGEATSPVIPYCRKVSDVAWERGAVAEEKTNGEVMVIDGLAVEEYHDWI